MNAPGAPVVVEITDHGTCVLYSAPLPWVARGLWVMNYIWMVVLRRLRVRGR